MLNFFLTSITTSVTLACIVTQGLSVLENANLGPQFTKHRHSVTGSYAYNRKMNYKLNQL